MEFLEMSPKYSEITASLQMGLVYSLDRFESWEVECVEEILAIHSIRNSVDSAV
jgi:hypothetical protein